MNFVELLAPAGSPEALDAAAGEGADAVYLGLRSFNARMRSANFSYSQFEGALKTLRRMGRKLYVTVNTVFEQREADRMYQLLKYLAALGPDGLIVQDFGVAAMVRDCFPSLKLHASTQMNIASARGANALSRYGFSRVVLARELSLAELRACRANTNMELEVFVHGALCVSASGLCLFSSYLGGKSANRGLCTQACRRYYRPDGMREDSPLSAPLSGGKEGYYFSPHDLQLLVRIPELAEAGINSFKIEGRMKSAEYVGTVVSAYRLVLDALAEEENGERLRETIDRALEILRNDFARSKTEFYYRAGMDDRDETLSSPEGPSPEPDRRPSGTDGGKAAPLCPDWLEPSRDGGTGISLGTILKVRRAGAGPLGLIAPRQILPRTGDSLRFHRADDSERRSHKLVAVEAADPATGTFSASPAEKSGKGGAGGCWISIPEGFGPGDGVYLIQTKAMSKRYPPVIPRNLDGFRRSPGRDKAPPLELSSRGKGALGGRGRERETEAFPGGFYVAVSRVEDLYILQSARPQRVILALTGKNAARLLGKGEAPLPFNKGEIILSLDPFFPQGDEEALAEEIKALMGKGYRQFMVNNPGHFSFFRGDALRRDPADQSPAAVLAAGPYLYVFNRWAASFVSSLGTEYFVSPLENNRQNLEKTLSPGRRSLCFVTVFAWPALFRVRADLGGIYGFKGFTDSRGEEFRLSSGKEGSVVYPERPFSIVDKIPFLREAGFSRFILDLSGPPLKKAGYRNLMKSVQNAVPLPDTSRFNWKNGFYQAEDNP
ncbi:MAG: U32 family peptidase [Treponema sp.]|jgi:putative protease|nr:U32 family peptidase [Treponema sp.]